MNNPWVQRALEFFVDQPQPEKPAFHGGAAPDSVAFPAHDAEMASQHPQANRHTVLGNMPIAYMLRRTRRRSIGFAIDAQGLAVSAPSWVSLRDIEAALQEKSGWIVRKLQETQQTAQREADRSIVWQQGMCLPYLGAMLRIEMRALCYAPSLESALDSDSLAQAYPCALPAARFPWILVLPFPRQRPSSTTSSFSRSIADGDSLVVRYLNRQVQDWYKKQARMLFTHRLDDFAPLLGVRWKSLSLTNARTRWGSARADGAIRLNWRLLHLRGALVDYVVVHELSHLREMNHSPAFWNAVAMVLPDYKALRAELKTAIVPVW